MLLYKSSQVDLYDIASGESIGADMKLPGHERSILFDRKTNTLISWGLSQYPNNQKQYTFSKFSVLDNAKPGFDDARQYKLPEFLSESKSVILLLNSRDNNVVILTEIGVYLFDLSSETLRLVSAIPIKSADAIIKDGYLVFGAYDQSRSAYEKRIMDLNNGKLAMLESWPPTSRSFIDYPEQEALLIGGANGVNFFRYKIDALDFKEYVEPVVEQTKTGLKDSVGDAGKSTFTICRGESGRLLRSDGTCREDTIGAINKKMPPVLKLPKSPVNLVEKGDAGLLDAIKRGLIRSATSDDLKKWTGQKASILKNLSHADKYVVLKPIHLKGGLSGAHSAVFIVNEERLTPVGDLGHSVILFTKTGACRGVLCG